MEHKMKTFASLLSAVLLALAFLPAVQAQGLGNEETTEVTGEIEQFGLEELTSMVESSATKTGESSWTIFWYLDHDNDIALMPFYITFELLGLISLLEVFLALIPTDLKVVVLFDGVLSGLHRLLMYMIDSIIPIPKWIRDLIEPLMEGIDDILPGDSFLLEFSSLSIRLLDDHGAVIPKSREVNMGDSQTLANFVTWGMEEYPSEHVGVILMDHGGGWKGACLDVTEEPDSRFATDTGTADLLTTPELGQAFKTVYEETGRKVDLLAYEACLMGELAVAYEVGDYVDYIAASEEVMLAFPPVQFLYLPILLGLGLNPDMGPKELGEWMGDCNLPGILFGSIMGYPLTYSTTDTAELDGLATSVDSLAQALQEKMDKYKQEIWDARLKTKNYYRAPVYHIVDLYDLASNLYDEIEDKEIRSLCVEVMEGVEKTVLTDRALIGDRSHGISIFFPLDYDEMTQELLEKYSSTSFAQSTQWDEFLDMAMEFCPYPEPLVHDLALQLVPLVFIPVLAVLVFSGAIGGGIFGVIKSIFSQELLIRDEANDGAEMAWTSLEQFAFTILVPICGIIYLILNPIAWAAQWAFGWVPIIGDLIGPLIMFLAIIVLSLIIMLLSTYTMYIFLILNLVFGLLFGFLNDFIGIIVGYPILLLLLKVLLFIPNKIIDLSLGIESKIFEELLPPPW